MALLNPTYDNDSLHDRFVKTVQKNYTIYVTFDQSVHSYKVLESSELVTTKNLRLKELLKAKKEIGKIHKKHAAS